ncbi:hypothetical protein PCA31118_01674 [Pandoraea captiosa]|uniref:Nucleoside-binding outer membrane protein n=1 Tax=Pandoraea captiosa TaxID=2508302 RepID=A0A5E4ZWK0_9BURK|nr:outer membrane protein OmpK [Pandoraea captiosa]VVE64645.1 hypothetical protein PCA31118_01674 [Pandoraea captiosa]
MKYAQKIGIVASGLALTLATAHSVAGEWSESDFQYRYGSNFNDNGGSGGSRISKNLVEFQNNTGFGWGRSYVFLLMSKAGDADNNSADLYSEGQVTASLSKLTGKELSWGAIRDLGVTAGYNYGARNSAYRSNARVLVYGGTVDFNVPGFTFFNVDLLAYHDAGTYGGYGGGFMCGRVATTYQVTPYWRLPFNIGPARFMFDGYVDFIGAHGSCAAQILAEPQLKLDVGNFWGYKDKLFVGVELQYWSNKFGTRGVNETVPQLVLQWKL